MTKHPKYIVVKVFHEERMFIFDAGLGHDVFYHQMQKLGYDQLVSAGHIDEYMKCYGESVSLFKQSRPEEDTKLLRSFLNMEEVEEAYYAHKVNDSKESL